ncbi:MAG: hypothetical protein JJU27_15680 [Gammaproteobacteria bacterium]|nr:hypothetical protein [Gammaproteobacteria bacterium]
MQRPSSMQVADRQLQDSGLRHARMLLALAFIVAIALMTSGCVTADIEQVRHSATGVERGERIVILARQHHNSHEAEDDFMQCVGNALERGGRGLEIASRKDFLNGLYPWFEPATAPLTAEELPALLARPGVAEQLTLTGVRYVVWMDGMTDRVDGGGSLACAISPAGGGCFGLGWWETDSKYEAAIWDLKTFDQAGTISTDYTGRSVVPAVVIPIPFIARTQANACRGMADQLHEFLVVGDAPIG